MRMSLVILGLAKNAKAKFNPAEEADGMSEPKLRHGNKWMPVLYAIYFGILKKVARRYGYALALHGSLTRDMDLVAFPWVEKPKSHISMLRAMNKHLGNKLSRGQKPYSYFEKKQHGRESFTICTGGGGYVDISIFTLPKPG